MNELERFATHLIEVHGGLVEPHDEHIDAILPPELTERLELPESVTFSSGPGRGVELSYGSELLESMLEIATHPIPFASARARVERPSTGRLASAAAGAFTLRNGVFDVGSTYTSKAQRLVVHALLVMKADEQRQLLVRAALSTRSRTPVEGFTFASAPVLEAIAPAELSREALEAIAPAIPPALWSASAVPIERFRASVQRRYERDFARIHHYFSSLEEELSARLEQGRIDAASARDKRAATEREHHAKRVDLDARFALQVELRPVAFLLVEAPIFSTELMLRRRKLERTIRLEYDILTRSSVPIACAACHGPAHQPLACDDTMHFLCTLCHPESTGRPRCPVCG